jgi:hypothetical protein
MGAGGRTPGKPPDIGQIPLVWTQAASIPGQRTRREKLGRASEGGIRAARRGHGSDDYRLRKGERRPGDDATKVPLTAGT